MTVVVARGSVTLRNSEVNSNSADGAQGQAGGIFNFLGGPTGLNDATEYVDGIMFPTKRRVYAYEGDYQIVPEPVLVSIDIKKITLSP